MSPTTTITALMRSVLLLAAAWSLAGCAATGPKHGGRDAPNVVFVTGEGEYRSEVTMPMLAGILASRHDMRTTVLYAVDGTGRRDPTSRTSIEGLEALESADLVVLFVRDLQLPDEQLAAILDYVESGRPIVALRTSTGAFGYPEGDDRATYDVGFGRTVLGQSRLMDHGRGSRTEVVIDPAAAGRPILRGVAARFSVRSWLFHVEPLQPGCNVLLEGAAVDSELTDDAAYPLQPVAWSRARKSASGDPSRVFYTSLGHPEDFETRSVRTLFVNAVFWSIGWEARIPADGCAADPMYPYIAPETRGGTAP